MAEVFSNRTFDPRRHSAVALAVSDKQPFYTGTKGEDVALKHYMVGPSVPPPTLSLRRPGTAPVKYRTLPTGQLEATPKYLNDRGRWVQEELPVLIADSEAQPLTATTTLTASLPGSGRSQPLRPVTAVYTYADVSPVVSADAVHDADLEQTVVKESTLTIPRARTPRTSLRQTAGVPIKAGPGETLVKDGSEASRKAAGGYGDPHARSRSIDSFWARQAGSAFKLGISDLDRTKELGVNTVAGSPNCRLIGSRWKHLERPTEGDVIYTDYYGRCGPNKCDYYGRAYNMDTKAFNKNWLVGDSDYTRVQASMPGIQALRTRPGLALDSTIVSGPAEKLDGLSMYKAKTQRGLHRLNEQARMKLAWQ